jgi:uncharacterized protein (TIGR00299 family) protein
VTAVGSSESRRLAWFHCFAGIAGDMACASLLDAGADEGAVRDALASLPLDGFEFEVHRVLRGGLTGTHVEVRVEPSDSPRTLNEILRILAAGKLPPRVLERSAEAFNRLAQVESSLHGVTPASVHFHELGAHDTIVDIVATMTALESLEIDEISASAVAVGSGTVRSGHGTIPNPAPAVLALLVGAPLYGRDVDVELTTPTGAAILVAARARFGPLPEMQVEATGYGAGGREIDGLPNLTQVVIGRAIAGSPGRVGQPQLLVEANVDDATGEELADAIAAVLDGGAADAWTTSVLMKKGRPGHVVSALVDLDRAAAVRELLLLHTGSLGVRSQVVDRFATSRRVERVELDGAAIRVKVTARRIKVEYDDAAALARRNGVPVRDILRRAEQAYFERGG